MIVGPFVFQRRRIPAVLPNEATPGLEAAPPATAFHFLIQLAPRLSVQWFVLWFDRESKP